MYAKIIKVGNSNGVVLPASFLKMLGVSVGSPLELEIKQDTKEIVLKSQVRAGWAAAFKKYAQDGEDELLIPDVFEDEAWG